MKKLHGYHSLRPRIPYAVSLMRLTILLLVLSVLQGGILPGALATGSGESLAREACHP
jgi:hypothetical protein